MSYPSADFPTPYDLYRGDDSQRVAFICQGCTSDILEGEDHYDIYGEHYCESCIAGMRKAAEYEDC